MTKENAKGYAQLILIIIFLGAIYALNSGLKLLKTEPKINQSNETSQSLNTVTLTAQSKQLSFTETAQITARSYVPIIPEASGRIISVASNFKTGACFKAHQILFRIDTDEASAEYERAQAELKQAIASLSLVKAEADAAIAEWEILNPTQKIPALVARKPQIDQAKAIIQTAKARVKLAKIGVGDTKFSYPFSGCVETSSVSVGQLANAGIGGQSLGQVFSYDSLEANVNLLDDKIKFLENLDHKVTLEIDNKSYQAKIDRISDIIDTQTQFRQVIIKPISSKSLKPNKIAKAVFTTKEPVKIFELQQNDLVDNTHIRIVDKSQKITTQEILVLNRSNNKIYIPAFAEKVTILRGSYYAPK